MTLIDITISSPSAPGNYDNEGVPHRSPEVGPNRQIQFSVLPVSTTDYPGQVAIIHVYFME